VEQTTAVLSVFEVVPPPRTRTTAVRSDSSFMTSTRQCQSDTQ